MENKYVIVSVNKKGLFKVPVQETTTLQELLNVVNANLKKMAYIPQNYQVTFKLNKNNDLAPNAITDPKYAKSKLYQYIVTNEAVLYYDDVLSGNKNADLIISKGQGNFEALSTAKREIFFLFKAKCPVIVRHAVELMGFCELGDIVLYRGNGKDI